MIIKSQHNKVFKRIHDGFIMGNEIHLGIDYSTGKARRDREEYYEQVEEILDEREQLSKEVETLQTRIAIIDKEEIEKNQNVHRTI